MGDIVIVSAGEATYQYRVAEIRRVARDDASMVAPTERPALTLITCTGTWLQTLGDFSHRPVVRAVLVM